MEVFAKPKNTEKKSSQETLDRNDELFRDSPIINGLTWSAGEALAPLFEHKFDFKATFDPLDTTTILYKKQMEITVCVSDLDSVVRVDKATIYVSDIHGTLQKALAAGAEVYSELGTPVIEIYHNLKHPLKALTLGSPVSSDSDIDSEDILPLESVDHLAICLPEEDFLTVIERYQAIFDLHICHEEYVDTSMSSMDSIALSNASKSMTLVFMKPRHGMEKSQIQSFMDENGGPGIQHVAFNVADILKAASVLKKRGIQFLDIPDAYYQNLLERLPELSEEAALLKHLGILVDKDEDGYLYQIFTKPLLEGRTVFIELIERRGSLGFGSGNIKALFKAVEADIKTNNE